MYLAELFMYCIYVVECPCIWPSCSCIHIFSKVFLYRRSCSCLYVAEFSLYLAELFKYMVHVSGLSQYLPELFMYLYSRIVAISGGNVLVSMRQRHHCICYRAIAPEVFCLLAVKIFLKYSVIIG
jgi:hypothetical protein